ncbi:MAG: 3-phosphoserine/phosphohydroxythreonine transaminase [Bacteroidia bacterium]|nr:3-phosphoserine/phosphohydroxythreonine transaminase [Bacteroidia bacterium]
MSKPHNFSAGPGILPQVVLEQAASAILNYHQSGLSILEVSHRGKDFVADMEKAQQLVKDLLNLPSGYSVLYLQGGASLQFLMVPYNLMKLGGKAAYANTGVWASKAIKEAKLLGEVVEVASSKDKNFSYIPKGFTIPTDVDYFHFTSNNTIYGTQFRQFPETKVPLVCDMSSDIFSRQFDASKFDLIYAGAQKNMGPAGTTMVIVKDELLGKTGRTIPSMLDYKVHIDGESMYNTPSVYAVYVSMLTLQWLKDNGGVAWIEEINNKKQSLFYQELDANPAFIGTAAKEDRSWMNATFLLKNESLDAEFSKLLKEANISGLKGHRSVGGYRASMYNALPLESVQVLVDVMREFGRKFA